MRIAVKRTQSGLLVADTTTVGFGSGENVDLDLEAPDPGESQANAISARSVPLSRFYGDMERRTRPEKA